MPLSKASGASEWIHHFVHSDDPRFKGKSKEERIQMALGAYYGADADWDGVMRTLGIDKEFSSEKRKQLAKSGKAMPGGRYPIENESDLRNAIQAFGRAKNKAATKAWIKKRAAALGKTELLPETWDAAEPDIGNPCPTCGGSGTDRDGNNCPTCDGTGIAPSPERDAASLDLFKDVRRRKDNDDDDDNGDWEEDDDDYGDAATIQMTDAFVVDGVRKTKDGYLVCDARIARTGIQLYAGAEVGRPDLEVARIYRPPTEVFSSAAMKSLAHRPITLNHPPVMVDSANWKQYAIGQTGDDVVRDGDHVRVPMVIMDAKAIEQYEKNGVCELSVGYSTELKWGKGRTPAGEVYDAKQTAIRGNHLAVVPAARGGSLLRIGDDERGDSTMATKVLIDGHTIVFDDELAAKHVMAYIAKLQDKKKNDDDDDDDDADDIEEERKKVTAEKDALNGEIVALKKQLADANAKNSGTARATAIRDSINLLLKANAVMDGKLNMDECLAKSDAEIHRVVVEAKLGEVARGMNDGELAGAFKALTAGVKARTGADRLADNLSMLQFGGGSNQNNPKAIKDAAYDQYVNDLTNAWRKPLAAQ